MRILINLFLIVIIIPLIKMCSGSSLPLKFIPLKQYDSQFAAGTLKDKPVTHKVVRYVVENYRNNAIVEAKLDSFGKGQTVSAAKVNDYQILLYKSSEKTNVKYLKENPRDLVRYSFDNDLLFIYTYLNGKFQARFKYKNGELIEPKGKFKMNVDVD